jgi:hypothetical protein
MKSLLIIVPLVFVLWPAAAEAQSRLRSAEGQQVFVIDADRREWQGKLLEVALDSMTIEGESGVRRFALAEVRRVDSDGDGVRDGFIKGALFGLLPGLVATRATGNAGVAVASMAVYGVLGMGIDALNRCKQTVYRAPAPQLAVKVSW